MTIMKYLKNHGYEFATREALQHQFSSALAQYQVLMQLVDGEMVWIIRDMRQMVSVGALKDTTPMLEWEYTNTQTSTATIQYSVNNTSSSLHPECPSAHLHNTCPLCFGGDIDATVSGVDLIVCIDANFQLKRNRDKDRWNEFEGMVGSLDPKVISPQTIFLSKMQIQEWEKRVKAIHPSKPKMGHKWNASQMEETEGDLMGGGPPNKIELGMNLPNETFDACQDSFITADGDCIKASSMYFDSTGVMALLCCHDHPLTLANLKTASEKQFYAFMLLLALMDSLPGHWRIGVLYDIRCQMHRMLHKWDLMPKYLDCLEFAVSIFHAYGHQWACQLWYHPWKAMIWGLSDGEGCECFWSELHKLIPGLCVTGVSWAVYFNVACFTYICFASSIIITSLSLTVKQNTSLKWSLWAWESGCVIRSIELMSNLMRLWRLWRTVLVG
jgi:Kyakuja-Dileera-Zisupton transposase